MSTPLPSIHPARAAWLALAVCVALDDDMRFSGKRLLSDGTWHEFIGKLKADGKIYCNDETSSWVLERKSQ
jgi:hypothetical protein